MALQKDTAEYRIAEYLCEMGGATQRDVFTALGPGSAGISKGLKQLEERSLTQKRTSGKTEYVSLTRKGREELEGGDDYYRENRELFGAVRLSAVAERTGFREAASMCMRCFGNRPELAPAVYRKHKPAPGLLFRAMFSRKTEEALEQEKGYLPRLTPEETDALLARGILYSSAEIKRCFSDTAVRSRQQGTVNRGAESVYGSRITAFLFQKTGITMFFRSAGPIPRFRYETEKEMIESVMAAGPSYYDRYRLKTDFYGTYHPTAVMIGRSPALIAALIMGYSKGRVRSPKSMEDNPWAKKHRRYYENRLFNPCCGLFDRVYCVPYHANSVPELRFVLRSTPDRIREVGAGWFRQKVGRCGAPEHERSFGDAVCAHDYSCDAEVVFSPAVDVRFYRDTLRKLIVDRALFPPFTVVTPKKYADAVSRAVGQIVPRMVDAVTGEDLHPVRYDVYGYPEDGRDRYTEASRKRWDSPNRPLKLEKGSFRLTEEAAKQLKAAAKKAGCTVSRLAGHLVAACLDSPEWEERFGKPEGKTAPYTAQLFEQDRRAGTNLPAVSSLSSLLTGGGA